MGRNLVDIDIHVEHYFYVMGRVFFFFFPTGLHKATSQLQKTQVLRCMDSHILVHVTASLKAKS